MNFQAVQQANGNNVTIRAIATQIEGTSYIPSGTPKQDCIFTDASGQKEKVTIWQGKGQPIPQQMQGQTLSINIKCKQKGEYVNYGGYWNSQAQGAPQQGQQAPPQQAQQQPAPQGGNNSTPDMIKARSMGLAYAKDLVVAGASKGLEGLFPLAQQCTAFITTGSVPHTQGPVEKPWDPEDLPT